MSIYFDSNMNVVSCKDVDYIGYLSKKINGRCKHVVYGMARAYKFNCGNMNFIHLRDIHKYNEPLIIYDGYSAGIIVGNDKSMVRNHWCYPRVVFPPFSDYTVLERANEFGHGTYTFTSSDEVDLRSYILDNHCDVMDFNSFHRRYINNIVRSHGWDYAYDSKDSKRVAYFTNVETGEVVYGYREIIDRINVNW